MDIGILIQKVWKEKVYENFASAIDVSLRDACNHPLSGSDELVKKNSHLSIV